MDFNTTALVAAVLLLATVLLMRRRDRGDPRGAAAKRDNLDTVADWPPTSVRVMTVAERESYELLRKALPGIMVLAQVPLSRFIRVPTRHSYSEWMQRVGSLSADLLLCDSGSKVLAVVDVRSAAETDRARRRHDRLARVLKAAGVKVYTWRGTSCRRWPRCVRWSAPNSSARPAWCGRPRCRRPRRDWRLRSRCPTSTRCWPRATRQPTTPAWNPCPRAFTPTSTPRRQAGAEAGSAAVLQRCCGMSLRKRARMSAS
jgi:Protein of unknown function (DUF2726)